MRFISVAVMYACGTENLSALLDVFHPISEAASLTLISKCFDFHRFNGSRFALVYLQSLTLEAMRFEQLQPQHYYHHYYYWGCRKYCS